jgi:hypothetical protein
MTPGGRSRLLCIWSSSDDIALGSGVDKQQVIKTATLGMRGKSNLPHILTAQNQTCWDYWARIVILAILMIKVDFHECILSLRVVIFKQLTEHFLFLVALRELARFLLPYGCKRERHCLFVFAF